LLHAGYWSWGWGWSPDAFFPYPVRCEDDESEPIEMHPSIVTTLPERLADWEKEPPKDLFGAPIWRLPAYRIALFLVDVAKEDASTLIRNRAPFHLCSQLQQSVDSIRSNISEGYSRRSGKERARFYEIAPRFSA
jgi:hypothetical protein